MSPGELDNSPREGTSTRSLVSHLHKMGGLRGAVLLLLLAGYLYLTVVVPWPYLSRTEGDFGNYYQAGTAILAGYSPYVVHNFDYPPLLAFLVAPLTWLSLDGARTVWFLMGQVCLLGAAAVTWRLLGGHPTTLVVVGTVWCLAGTIPENLVLGQLSPLLLLLLVVAFHWFLRRPRRAACLVGVAAALKLWPMVLLLPYALRRQWRSLWVGLLTMSLLILGPLVLIATFLGPPYVPASHGYWLGTPAVLNFSLPAVVLRTTDRPAAGQPLPTDWVHGNNPKNLELTRGQTLLSAGTSLVTLAVCLLLLFWSGGFRRGNPDGHESELPTLAALTALTGMVAACLVASPISWYHYQLCQFPALALLADSRLRRRAVLPLVAVALLALGLTRAHTGFSRYVEAYGWTAAHPPLLWLALTLVPALNLVLVVWLSRETRLSAGGAEGL